MAAPSRLGVTKQWPVAAFVPDHSGGPVPVFHRIPSYAHIEHLMFQNGTREENKCQGEIGLGI